MARRARERSLLAVVLAAMLAAPSATLAVTGKTAILCRTGVSKAMLTYAKKRRDVLLICTPKLLKCEVELEADGDNPTSCRIGAADYCTDWLQPSIGLLALLESKTDLKATGSCDGLERLGLAGMLSTAAGGLWYANDPVCSTAANVPALVACIRGRVSAEVDADVSRLLPRAGMLLDNAGFGGGFADLVRPPTQDLTIAAMAPASGVLVDPGTINLAIGTALRFTADAATLPCPPSGNNGQLTITVGSGATAQERKLKEPYGNTVTVGPFTAATSVPYSIALKDGGCDSTVSGTISVP